MVAYRKRTKGDIPTYTAKSVEDFLSYLLPSGSHWQSAKRGDLAYRGQICSEWQLIPTAFRKDTLLGYEAEISVNSPNRVVPQAASEFRAVHEFVVAADAVGLQVPEEGSRLLLQGDPSQRFRDPHWHYGWPQKEILETLALAQHHGVPTRLLDFTEDPMVGAFFSAFRLWEPKLLSGRRTRKCRYVAVWVLDLRFVRALSKVSHRYPERLAEIRVPRANNSYLHAQYGFFLTDLGANDVMASGKSLAMDETVFERANFWKVGRRLAGHRITPEWFDEIPLRLVRLPSSLAGELLQELADRGISKASLMPSLDRVVESLELQRFLRMQLQAH